MRYEEIVEKVRVATSKANVSRAVGHIAFQINVEGEGEGAFYVEIADGKVYVEPYEYYDRDLIIVTTADVIMQMIEGGLKPMVAYTNEQLKAYGNIDYLKVLPLGHDNKQAGKPVTEPEKISKPQDIPAKEAVSEIKEGPAKEDVSETQKIFVQDNVTAKKEVPVEKEIPETKEIAEMKNVPETKSGSYKKARKKHRR